MRARFRQGEVVRVARAAGSSPLTAGEGVVEEVAGPNEEGTGWNLTVRLGDGGSRELLVSVPESELEATGLALDEHGERVPVAGRPRPEMLRDRIELRLFSAIVDGLAAARAAEEIEHELATAVGGASITIVAERHWSRPYPYEFAVTLEPRGSLVEALTSIARIGEGGWIATRDDGWRFDLWWNGDRGESPDFLVPEIHAAEVALLPWRSPRRRPEAKRPLLPIEVRPGLDEPGWRT